jgi:hypothetical protein
MIRLSGTLMRKSVAGYVNLKWRPLGGPLDLDGATVVI